MSSVNTNERRARSHTNTRGAFHAPHVNVSTGSQSPLRPGHGELNFSPVAPLISSIEIARRRTLRTEPTDNHGGQ